MTVELINEIRTNSVLTPSEDKVANRIIQQLNVPATKRATTLANLEMILAPPIVLKNSFKKFTKNITYFY